MNNNYNQSSYLLLALKWVGYQLYKREITKNNVKKLIKMEIKQ